MHPSRNYGHFALAKERNMTVATLLTGKLQPLSAMEEYLWQRWEVATQRFREQAE